MITLDSLTRTPIKPQESFEEMLAREASATTTQKQDPILDVNVGTVTENNASPEEIHTTAPIGVTNQPALGVTQPTPQVHTIADHDQYLGSTPMQETKASIVPTSLEQIFGEASRTKGGVRDRIAQDTPKDSGVPGWKQSKSVGDSFWTTIRDWASELFHWRDERKAQTRGSIEPEASPHEISHPPPGEGRVIAANPLAQLRDVFINLQAQVTGMWGAAVQAFDTAMRRQRTQTFITPAEEEGLH